MREEKVAAALAVLEDLAVGEEITREDLPFLRLDALKARREFTEEELTPGEHAARLAALDLLETEL